MSYFVPSDQPEYDRGHADGYEQGRQAGYLDGYSEGIRQGREEGYEDGYAAGYDACEHDVNWEDSPEARGYQSFIDDMGPLPSEDELLDSENYVGMDADGDFEEPEEEDENE